jgi:hypothetical protein
MSNAEIILADGAAIVLGSLSGEKTNLEGRLQELSQMITEATNIPYCHRRKNRPSKHRNRLLP